MNTIQLDTERQIKAKEYARINRRITFIGIIWNLIYAAIWLFTGLSLQLETVLQRVTDSSWLLVALFAAIFGGISMILEFPLSYYSEFVLPHQYDLSNETPRSWIIDQLKGLLVSIPLGLLLLEIIYSILRAYPETWWIWGTGVMLFFTVILSSIGPTFIAPIFNKYTPLDKDHEDLANRLKALAEKTHTPIQGVYKFDMSRRTKTANAALTGIGRSRRIILGDTLINEFDPDEIETVLAHELGHQVHKDLPVGILINTAITFLGFYLISLILNWGLNLFSFKQISDLAAFPLLILAFGIYSLMTMPLSNAYSRWREYRADQFALQVTGKSKAFESAMTRLANQNLADADPEPWVEFIFYSHPAIHKRIAMAQAASQNVQ